MGEHGMRSRPETRVIKLADRRDLAWIEVGDPGGIPVVALHGSPGRGADFAVYHATASKCGVRVIAVDRPGYGHSAYQPRRCLSDWPGDVTQLADHLGLERFGVIGHSAGGPHALACARFLPRRLLGCGILSGLAPQARTPMTQGMLLSNRIQTALYRSWPPILDGVAVGMGLLAIPLVAPMLRLARRQPEREVDRTMRQMLPECHAAVVSRPEIHASLVAEAATFNCGTLRSSIQDMALCIRDWGFELQDIETPIHIWHGELDRNVPVTHAHSEASAIPSATLHLCAGEGHWLLVDHMAEVLPVVAATAF
jgi:pimeloyl-ACP methyl ester carboxylesterase